MINPLFCIVGETSSGKDTLTHLLCDEHPITSKLCKKVLSYTNRPMRQGEVNGVEHIFISDEEFQKMKKDHEYDIIAYTHIKKEDGTGYEYMALRSELLHGANVYIIDPNGIEDLLRRPILDFQLHVIYISANQEIRMQRALTKRHDARIELLNRMEAERDQFETFRSEKRYDVIIDNNSDDILGAYQSLVSYVLEKLYFYSFQNIEAKYLLKNDNKIDLTYLGKNEDLDFLKTYTVQVVNIHRGVAHLKIFNSPNDTIPTTEIMYDTIYDFLKDWRLDVIDPHSNKVRIMNTEYTREQLKEAFHNAESVEELIKFQYRNVPHVAMKINTYFHLFKDLLFERMDIND